MIRFQLDNGYIDIFSTEGRSAGSVGVHRTRECTHTDYQRSERRQRILRLDLANAYESIPHQLVKITLERYYVPTKMRDILQIYFDSLKMRFSVRDYITDWQRLEVGIITGCTIYVILFAAAMDLLVKSADKKSRGPLMSSGDRQLPIRAFMDDMTITTKTVVDAKLTLKELQELISWREWSSSRCSLEVLYWRRGRLRRSPLRSEMSRSKELRGSPWRS